MVEALRRHKDQRASGRESRRVDERDRLGLGGETDRCLASGNSGPAGHGGLSVDGVGRHLPRTVSGEPGDTDADRGESAAPLSVQPSDGEPRFPAESSNHGADPVDLVPAVRPQSANVRPERFLGEAKDYRKATQRIYHAPGNASFIELPLVKGAGAER